MFISIGVPKLHHPWDRVVPKITLRCKRFQKKSDKSTLPLLHVWLPPLPPSVNSTYGTNIDKATTTNELTENDEHNGIIHTGYKICSIDEDRK